MVRKINQPQQAVTLCETLVGFLLIILQTNPLSMCFKNELLNILIVNVTLGGILYSVVFV